MLVYYPKLKDEIDIKVIGFRRPRAELVALLGEEYQGCPVLVLSDRGRAEAAGLPVREANGMSFLDDDKAIGQYLSRVYGVSRPAHD